MKKIYVIIIGLALLAGSCSDFTEIDPKGKNVLNRVEDLDLLLNYEYYLSVSNKQVVLINDFYPSLVNIPNLLTESIRTLNGAYVSWDENANRTELVETDNTYTELYSIIGKVANPVLLNVDAASGDRTMTNRLKAEALVLRGWFHYLLVNIYAKAYNPATAATDPGIVYALETDAVETPNEKLSVEQVYELILADINAALELSSLPISPAGMRVGLPFAYAVKAKVLMSMRDYDGAFEAAGESLKLKSTIDDYSNLLQPENLMGTGTMEFTRPYLTLEEELLESPCYLMLETMTPELWNMFEEGHILKDYLLTDQKLFGMPTMGMTYLGLNVPCLYAMNTYYSPLGLTTVDMYLTQAECYIREGKVAEAMDLLNQIREKRLVNYTEATAASAEDAFAWLKRISRTENFATLKNFINLKRWNTEPAYQETLRKTIEWDVNTYDAEGNVIGTERKTWSGELTPDSPLWIFPFPQNATNYNPNLTQNYETGN